MSKVRVVAVVTLATNALRIATASASPVHVETMGDACDVAALAPQIAKLVQVDSSTTAKVEVVARGSSVEASVRFVDDDGTVRGPRVITAGDCNQLVESVAIVIAMALHEDVAPAPRVIAPATRIDVPPRVVRETTLETIAASPAPRRNDQLAVVLVGGSGMSSQGITAQLTAGVRWRRGDGSIGAEVRADSPDREHVGLGQIDVSRAQVSIEPCLHRGPLAMCGLVSAGMFYGSSNGFAVTGGAYSPLLATGFRTSFERALTDRVALRAHVDADALITTTGYEIDYMETWRSPRFELSAGIGVLAQFL